VAPYWSDHDIRREGEVSYEIFEKGRSSYGDMLLDRVNTYLAANVMTNFTGTFMILAEWKDVHPYPHGSGSFDFFEIYYPSIRSFTSQVLYVYELCYLLHMWYISLYHKMQKFGNFI